MSREGKEFPVHVIEYALRKSGGGCERCGSKEQIEINHILPIWFAAEYFPQIASWALKSAQNAEALCHKCHVEYHRENDEIKFMEQAMVLITLMGDLLL